MTHSVFSLFWALLLPLLVWSTPISTEKFPLDCSDVYAHGHTLSDVYTIYPTEDTPVQVYCDMGSQRNQTNRSNVGGWTVFQRRIDGSVSFYRPWENYKYGFGEPDHESWLGLETLHKLTRARRYELQVDLQDFDGSSVFAHYTHFTVFSESDGYRLSVSGFINGGAGDSMGVNNLQKFSTFDKDQDSLTNLHCARKFLGGYWYNNCHRSNPNGIYLGGTDNTHNAIGNVWSTWKGYDRGLKSITMKIRPVP